MSREEEDKFIRETMADIAAGIDEYEKVERVYYLTRNMRF